MRNENTETSQETTEPSAGNQDEKKFTQSDLDRIIKDRMGRFEKKLKDQHDSAITQALENYRSENGIDDEILEKVKGYDEKDSESRKIRKEYQRLEKEKLSYEQKYNSLRKMHEDTVTRSAIISAAASKAISPENVWKIIRDEIKVDEDMKVYVMKDGERSDVDVNEFVSDFLNNNKYLLAPTSSRG
jgi:hypothetical protein